MHEPEDVVYTGTHDNDTTLGWYLSLDEATRGKVDSYLGRADEPMPWPLVRQAMSSVANAPATASEKRTGSPEVAAKRAASRITSYNVCYTKLLRIDR